ncbi:hypothetical protein M2155_000539 [Streptomyces sp. SAI-119]|nr:hypothetical protein [Streptomyces sp. SAI-119]
MHSNCGHYLPPYGICQSAGLAIGGWRVVIGAAS